MGTLRDKELASYAGILYLNRPALLDLLHGCGIGTIRQAGLIEDKIEITWQTGDKSWLPWHDVKERAHLDALPAPEVAFASDAEHVGLLIKSETPHPLLAFREPHSVVRSIGELTVEGLEPQSGGP